jgi:beta-galactosidase
MVRLWTLEAIAHGAEAVSYFRWRQAPFAQEQMHAGLLRPDSAPAQALAEVAEVARELTEAPETAPAQAEVALVFDYESAWAWEIQPQGRDFSYFRLVFETYQALRRLGLDVDFVAPDCADLSAWKLVLAPGLATLSPPLKTALAAHRGTALVGPRANSKTAEFATPVPLPPALPGLDATVARVESLPPGLEVPLAGGGRFLHWREKVQTTAEVLHRSDDGWPALMREGGLHYLAGWPDAETMIALVEPLCRTEGIVTRRLPEGLRQRRTASEQFLFNYAAAPILWEGQEIPAAGVLRRPRRA